MARTLRLDLLGRTNIAVGSDLPITSWMVRHAAWLLSLFQTGSADGKTAYARQFERPYESLVLPFAERVMNTPMSEGDPVYVEPPEGLYKHNDTVWCLKRALNGLRDASRLFHEHFAHITTWFRTIRSTANSFRGS